MRLETLNDVRNDAVYRAISFAVMESNAFLRRSQLACNTYVVVRPDGQSTVFDEDIAKTMAAHAAANLEQTVFVVQLTAVSRPLVRVNAQPLPPSESGEPPDGRCA